MTNVVRIKKKTRIIKHQNNERKFSSVLRSRVSILVFFVIFSETSKIVGNIVAKNNSGS